jgi:hypothetical protein
MLGGIECFHTTDLVHQQGEFKDFSRDDSNRMLKRAVAIIKERASVAVLILCQRQEFEAVAPTWQHGFGDPYPICCHFCMMLLGDWLNKRSPASGDIAYFFESGNQHTGEANDLMSLARLGGVETEVGKSYRYRSHSFIDRRDAAPLQAADLLAWEWTKAKDETVDRALRPARRSLRELMGGNRDNFLERHLTGTHLKIFCEETGWMNLFPNRQKK